MISDDSFSLKTTSAPVPFNTGVAYIYTRVNLDLYKTQHQVYIQHLNGVIIQDKQKTHSED